MTRHYNPATMTFDEIEDRITCSRCGAQGLHWQVVFAANGMDEYAALFNERNRKHVCPEPSADDFSELS